LAADSAVLPGGNVLPIMTLWLRSQLPRRIGTSGASPENSGLMVASVEQISESGCAANTLTDDRGSTDANRL
jgi:hypothetical protein